MVLVKEKKVMIFEFYGLEFVYFGVADDVKLFCEVLFFKFVV